MAFRDYSKTPGANTNLSDGTFIGPNMLRNKVRPALQAIAADGAAIAEEVTALTSSVRDLWLPNGSVSAVTSLQLATPSDGDVALLSAPGRAGTFAYRTGSYSALVTADPTQGVYVALSSNLTGSAGAWVRQFDGSVNVRWAGPTQNGIANDAPAFTSANAMGSVISVPDGPYYISTAPTLTKIFEFSPGAILTGAAAGSFGYAANCGGIQTIATATTPDQYATRYIRRNANHTGGTPGYTSAGVRIDTFVSAGVTNYEWALISTLDNSATAGENVAAFFKSTKRPGAGPTFGAVIENIDKNVDPTSGSVSLEVDVEGNGTDALNNRVGVDLVIRKDNPAGAAFEAGWGFRISGNGTDKVKTGFGAIAGTRVNIGFDTSAMITDVAAFRMATNQVFQFNAAGTRYMTHTGGALSFLVSGTQVAAIGDSGAYSVGTNQVVGARGAAVADATDAASAITQLNLLLARLRASTGHGLIA